MEDKEIKKTESNNNGEPNSSPLQLRGLYSKVNISVKTLDKIIGVLFVAIVICVVIGLTNNGFKVDFNSLGGSYIEPKRYEYGKKVEVENPTREGYEFDYWALDENCNIRANLDTMIVDSDFTLYACWLKK